MIIYCTKLWLSGTLTNKNNIIQSIARWLGSKVGEKLSASDIKNIDKRYVENKDKKIVGGRISSIETDSNLFPWLYSIKYSHGDSEVGGRQWITEIGLRQTGENEQFECSVLLKTEEASTRVEGQKRPTIPNIVKQICEKCNPTDNTPGIRLINFNDSDKVFMIKDLINSPLRAYAIVVISADNDNKCLLDPYFASNYLKGTAQVVYIPTKEDSHNFSYRIGKQYSAWNGGINIIYPAVKYEEGYKVFSRRVLPEYFEDECVDAKNISSEVLSLILDKTNLLSSWRHISSDNVNEINRKRSYERIKNKVNNSKKENNDNFFEEYINSLEDSKLRLINKLEEAKAESESYAVMYDEADQLYRESRNQISSLKMLLNDKEDSNELGFSSEVVLNLIKIISNKLTPEESLNILSTLYSDRIVILPEALKSARSSKIFKYKEQLFDLLLLLITEYYISIKSGNSDKEAGAIFGESYAPRESETVENNAVARKLRTFYYQGERYEMMRHLKIGVKDSIAETIRVHFDWLPEEKKILIGHCGRHLDHG